jgi:hypothetical protein
VGNPCLDIPQDLQPKPMSKRRGKNNPGCDGNACKLPGGQLRIMPIYGEESLILCKDCYNAEIEFRKYSNKYLPTSASWDLPDWHSLAIYKERR